MVCPPPAEDPESQTIYFKSTPHLKWKIQLSNSKHISITIWKCPIPASSEAATAQPLPLPRSFALPPFSRCLLLTSPSTGSHNCPLLSLHCYLGTHCPFCPSWVLPPPSYPAWCLNPASTSLSQWRGTGNTGRPLWLTVLVSAFPCMGTGPCYPSLYRRHKHDTRRQNRTLQCENHKEEIKRYFCHCLLQGRVRHVKFELFSWNVTVQPILYSDRKPMATNLERWPGYVLLQSTVIPGIPPSCSLFQFPSDGESTTCSFSVKDTQR